VDVVKLACMPLHQLRQLLRSPSLLEPGGQHWCWQLLAAPAAAAAAAAALLLVVPSTSLPVSNSIAWPALSAAACPLSLAGAAAVLLRLAACWPAGTFVASPLEHNVRLLLLGLLWVAAVGIVGAGAAAAVGNKGHRHLSCCCCCNPAGLLQEHEK
jgi:hypothetical protein